MHYMYFALDMTTHLWSGNVYYSALFTFPSLFELRKYHAATLSKLNTIAICCQGEDLKLEYVELMMVSWYKVVSWLYTRMYEVQMNSDHGFQTSFHSVES